MQTQHTHTQPHCTCPSQLIDTYDQETHTTACTDTHTRCPWTHKHPSHTETDTFRPVQTQNKTFTCRTPGLQSLTCSLHSGIIQTPLTT